MGNKRRAERKGKRTVMSKKATARRPAAKAAVSKAQRERASAVRKLEAASAVIPACKPRSADVRAQQKRENLMLVAALVDGGNSIPADLVAARESCDRRDARAAEAAAAHRPFPPRSTVLFSVLQKYGPAQERLLSRVEALLMSDADETPDWSDAVLAAADEVYADYRDRMVGSDFDDWTFLHCSAWNSNLQPDFNVNVCDIFNAIPSAVFRELDESNRFVQKTAKSTSI